MLDTQTVHAPELPTGLRWLNSNPIALKQLRGNDSGRVVLLDFWDYTCVNCGRTLPYVIEWAAKYKDQGLVTIGVHAPEFAFAREGRQIEKACAEFGITYPVVLDNDYAIWQAYDNKAWPSKYLIDAQGYVRYSHIGEGEYLATEMAIQYALRESNPNFKPVPFTVPKRGEDSPGAKCYRPSPELYLGYERSDIGNPEGVEKHVVMLYHDSGERGGKHAYVQGAWRSQDEYIELVGSHGHLAFNYNAKEVNVVMSPTGDLVELMLQGQGGVLLGGAASAAPPVVRVLQDGAPLRRENAGADVVFNEQGEAFVMPTRPRMYKLVNNPDFESHELRLVVEGKGFAAYAVSFTTCVAR
ncbi:MAG: redoxin family protein [Anaerolineae bacterium]|nr:redoxin family protein [Anaerolineae bacterium]